MWKERRQFSHKKRKEAYFRGVANWMGIGFALCGCVTAQSCAFAIQFPLDAKAAHSSAHTLVGSPPLWLIYTCMHWLSFGRDTKGRPPQSSPSQIKLHAAAIDPAAATTAGREN